MKRDPRIKGVRPVGNEVPRALKPILNDIREAIHQLNGTGLLAAVRYQDFLKLLRENIGQVPIPSRPSDQTPISVITDPYFQDLKKQTEQALKDLASMFALNAAAEMLVRDNREYVRSVEQDVIAQASELEAHALELASHTQELLALATDIDAIEAELHDPLTGLDAQATLLAATVTRVDNNENSINALTAAVTSLESEIVDVAALDPAIMWQFESSADGWTSNATLTPDTAHVRIGAAANTHFTSPAGIAINGALFPRLVARIRRVSGTGWLGRATYVTTGSGAHGFDPVNYHLTLVSEPNLAGGGWVIVTWNMELLTAGGNDWITHVIDQIRLELSDDDSTVFDVDWVAIARVAPSYVTATVQALESRVTAAENEIDALSAAITTLETDVSDLQGEVSANSLAISTLNTRVTTAENEIAVNSAAIQSLAVRMDDAESDIGAHATALSGLEADITSINDELTAHASDLTSLDARLDTLEPTVASHGSAISSLQTSVTNIGNTVTTHSSQLTSLDSRLADVENDLDAQASAIDSLDTRVEQAENSITSHALQLTELDSRLEDAENDIAGQATAISTLDARVTQNEAGISAQAAQVTMLQAYGRDANRINPLNIPGNATDWNFSGSDVVPINLGGRNTVAGRIRTSGNVMRVSKFVEIEPRGIYEVRLSFLKNRAHGRMYVGLYTSQNGVDSSTDVIGVINRQLSGGPTSNPYWTWGGVQGADHSDFVANRWYDFVFYILGSEADPALCPEARVNDVRVDQSGFERVADGYRLQPGQRFAALRVLNYYNAVQTDAYFNNFSITRLDNQRTAALTEEIAARVAADGTLGAEWTIKLQANDYVAGIGLAMVGGQSGPIESSFNILADRFAVALPGVSGPVTPFVIGNVNGTPRVGINGNLVVDGTIVTRHLVAEAITTPTIAPGAVTRQTYVQSSTVFSFTGGQTFTTLSLPVTVQQAGPVRVDWYCELSHATNVNPRAASISLFRGSTGLQSDHMLDVEVTNWLGHIFRPIVHTYFDSVNAGQYTYNILISTAAGSGLWDRGLAGIAVTQLMR